MAKVYTRKFLIKKLPNIEIIKETKNKRFYLYFKNGTVIRVQAKDNLYELERKIDESSLIKASSKLQINEDEYHTLSKNVEDVIDRKTIIYSQYPQLKIRIYEGKYKGLIRAEVNFKTEKEVKAFIPYDWFDKEITDSPVGKDATLLRLSPNEMREYIK